MYEGVLDPPRGNEDDDDAADTQPGVVAAEEL